MNRTRRKWPIYRDTYGKQDIYHWSLLSLMMVQPSTLTVHTQSTPIAEAIWGWWTQWERMQWWVYPACFGYVGIQQPSEQRTYRENEGWTCGSAPKTKFGTSLWVSSKKKGIQYKKKFKQYLVVENTSYQSSPHLLHKKFNLLRQPKSFSSRLLHWIIVGNRICNLNCVISDQLIQLTSHHIRLFNFLFM